MLRESSATCQFLTFLAAGYGVRNGDLGRTRPGAAVDALAEDVYLADGSITVSMIEDVVGVAGSIGGGGRLDNGGGLLCPGSTGRRSGHGA